MFTNCHKSMLLRMFILSLITGLLLGNALPAVYAMPETLIASPGTLDSSFGVGGKVTTDFDGKGNGASSIIVQPDGKIVLAGASNGDFALARYNSDGSLDPTFGTDGKVTTDFASNNPLRTGDYASDAVLQPDGKIVAAGMAHSAGGFGVARYNSDGSLDTSFNGDGRVVTTINGDDYGSSLALQPDGKIVVAGMTTAAFISYNALIRYNPDGSLDTTFSGDGKLVMDFGGRGIYTTEIVLQPDGKILLASTTSSYEWEMDFALARYNSDGTLDPTFGEGGKTITDIFNPNEYCEAVALQSDGKIVVAGRAQVNGGSYALLARYNTDGTLDPTFGTDGKVVSDFGGTLANGSSVAIQPNGRIVLGGGSWAGDVLFVLERYHKDGSRDTTFGVDGRSITVFAGNGQPTALAIQQDGKILLAGQGYPTAGNPDFVMARYLGDQTRTVTKTADTNDGVCDSDCSLREAVEAASADVPVNFATSLSGQTITLNSTLLIDKDLTIDGSGLASQIAISGNDRVSVLEIADGVTTTINRLIISNGSTEDWHSAGGILNNGTLLIANSTIKENVGIDGGGIKNTGFLEIVNSTITNNSAEDAGGGILNYGTLTVRNGTFDNNSSASGGGILNEHGGSDIQNSTFSGNSVTISGGAISVTSGTVSVAGVAFTDNSAESGGALYYNVLGTFEVKDSIFSGNSAVAGGAIATAADTTTITNSIFSDNSASYNGGGIHQFGGKLLTITGSTFQRNSALNWGGGITSVGNGNLMIINSHFVENSALNGGGISNARSLIVHQTEFLNNSALANDPMQGLDGGGGIYNFGGDLTITESNFIGNTSLSTGGGIVNIFLENNKATVKNSTFHTNSAVQEGGGISSETINSSEGSQFGTLEITNSTFSSNTASKGGGVFNGKAVLTTKNSTFSGNKALQGGSIYNDTWGGTLHLLNSILANSGKLNANGVVEDCYSGAGGMGTSVRNIVELNGVGDNACGVPFTNADPGLDTLADNGGFTQTMALFPDSPAINAGEDASCPAADQRGVTRPQGSRCDIGAYETEGTVKVSVAGVEVQSYPLVAGESLRASLKGFNSGPVKIIDVNGTPLIAAERVIYKVNGVNTSFSEMMALPDNQLYPMYWFPWYNNKDLDTQLRIANVSNAATSVHVYIGGIEMQGSPFTLAAGESTRKSFPGVNNGPVKIISKEHILASERVIYKVNNVNTSFSEMMGLPARQLDTTYWLPWYNNRDLDTQLRIANVNNMPTSVHIYIGGKEMTGSPFTLGANASTRLSFANINAGPVKIKSDFQIVAAERVIYKDADGVNTSFSEMMALPDNALDTTYWLPWYNNKDLDTQLRFANVSSSPAMVHVFIGGQEMGAGFALPAGGSTRLSFPGINSGPVRVVSDVGIVVAERVIYKVNSTPTSFSEMMGLPESPSSAHIFWLPWYNNVDLDTQLRFGMP